MFRFVELKKENGRRERKSGKRSSLDIWCREGRKSRFYPECFVSCDDSTTKESGRKKEKHSFFTAEYPTFMQRRESGILSRMFRATMLVEWNGRKKTGGKSDEKRKTDIFGVKEKKRIEDFYFVSRKEESRSNERRGGEEEVALVREKFVSSPFYRNPVEKNLFLDSIGNKMFK